MAQKSIPRAGNDKPTPSQRLVASYRQLKGSVSELSSAADELAEVISSLEVPLKSLKPQVAAWFKIAAGEDRSGGYWHRDLGYALVNRTWGIALRTVEGHEALDEDNVESWLFKDAPKWMQIESVSKIPDLFDELIRRADNTTNRLRAKTEEALELAAALKQVVDAEGEANS